MMDAAWGLLRIFVLIVVINNNCSIGSHTDIGHDGSSFERYKGDVSSRVPHFGRVFLWVIKPSLACPHA